MKILLFTHKIDIDGMGNAVLGKLAFDEINYVLCETFDINNQVNQFYESGRIYDYDMIFVTDICIKEPLLSTIANDNKLNGKVKIFDHHITEIKEGNDKYEWVNIVVEDDLGKCSGTSLFYQYLVEQGFIEPTNGIDTFVELTRRYDTWEWQTKYNDKVSYNLNLLFNVLGSNSYIKLMAEKLRKNHLFNFTDIEQEMINNSKSKINEKVSSFIDNMELREINNYRVGITFVEDEYRNDVAMEIRKRNIDIDLVMMILLTRGTISYRNIKSDVDVSEIAVMFGGKGHKEASSSPITSDIKEEIINLLVKR